MKVKIVQNKVIRVWKYPSLNKYQSLLSFIAKTFGLLTPSSFSLQYQDDEGDNINITADNDIDDALLCAKEESRKSLKIYLISRTAMDDFLNDALGDIFCAKTPIKTPIKTVIKHHNKNKKIPSKQINSKPKKQAPQRSKSRKMSPQQIIHMIPPNKHKHKHKNKKKAKAMNPEDILSSMFEEEEQKKPAIMSPDDILSSMVMDMNGMNNMKAASPYKQFQAKAKVEQKQKQKQLAPPMPIPDADELLLQHLLNNAPSKLVRKAKVKMESDDDLLSNLLNESDREIYKAVMDPQDIINSIVNKPEATAKAEVAEVEEEEEEEQEAQAYEQEISRSDEVHELSVSELKLDASAQVSPSDVLDNNADIDSAPMRNPYYGQLQPQPPPPQPTISAKVPPAPFYARSPHPQKSADADQRIANGNHQSVDADVDVGDDVPDDADDGMALLAKFDGLPDVPHHKIGGDGEESKDSDGEEEEEDEGEESLDESTLEEIRQSIHNPMDFHHVNIALISADSKRQNLVENNAINPIANNVQGEDTEIDKLYAELDDIDMEFEINRISSNDKGNQENKENTNINNEENKEDAQIIVDDKKDTQIAAVPPVVDDGIDHEVDPQNVAANDNDNDNPHHVSDEIIIGIDPSNFNTESDDDDDDDMDITQTTPDPVPIAIAIAVPIHNNEEGSDNDMDIEPDNQQNNVIPNLKNNQKPPPPPPKSTTSNQPISPTAKATPPSSPKALPLELKQTATDSIASPRVARREIGRVLREEQREQQKKQKLCEKQQRLALKKALLQHRKLAKEEEKLKRLALKESRCKQQKYEKLRRLRLKELNQFRAISQTQSEIFTVNKNWYPLKFILNTQTQINSEEYETYSDLIQIIELIVTKKYQIHPLFIECIFNHNHNDNNEILPSEHHCIVYIYYNWRSVLNIKYQSINLGLSDNYITKVNVFRMPPWINMKRELKNEDANNDEVQMDEVNPNDIYDKYLECEMAKCRLSHKRKSPLSLFKFKNKNKDKENAKPSLASLLPENCEKTPNFRWKFDLTQDYLPFDPLLNDNLLCEAMHEYEIYFVQIRCEAVASELPRLYDIFVVYLNCCNVRDDESVNNLFCNMGKKGIISGEKTELEIFLLSCLNDKQEIVEEILSYLSYGRCYGFVTVAKNTCPDSQNPITEQVTFHYGSIADWIKCAIVGEKDFEYDLKQLQKYAKWNNKQHISLIAFLNSIQTTYTM